MRSSEKNRAEEKQERTEMISFPEPDTGALAWGWVEAAQWYNFCPALNDISGDAQISKHRDLLGTSQLISKPGLGLDRRESRFTTPVVSKRSFVNTGHTQPFCCAPTVPSS